MCVWPSHFISKGKVSMKHHFFRKTIPMYMYKELMCVEENTHSLGYNTLVRQDAVFCVCA